MIDRYIISRYSVKIISRVEGEWKSAASISNLKSPFNPIPITINNQYLAIMYLIIIYWPKAGERKSIIYIPLSQLNTKASVAVTLLITLPSRAHSATDRITRDRFCPHPFLFDTGNLTNKFSQSPPYLLGNNSTLGTGNRSSAQANYFQFVFGTRVARIIKI